MRRFSNFIRSNSGRHQPRRRRLSLESLESRKMMAVVFGDFNGDSFDDMATGVPGEGTSSLANVGAVSVIYSRTDGKGLDPAASISNQLWFQNHVGGRRESGDNFGAALAVGDFNNDSYADLVIGVPGEDLGSIQDAGAMHVVYGSSSGLSNSTAQLFHQDSKGMQEMAEAFDRFGMVLSSGDFDGDGYDDVAIGVPHENVVDANNINQLDAGVVQILYGSSTGLKTDRNQLLVQTATDALGENAHFDHFGASLTSGNFNGDTQGGNAIDDLAIGVPGEDSATLQDIGMVNVVYGTASGLDGILIGFTQDSTPLIDGGLNSGLNGSPAEAWDSFGSALASGDFDGDGLADLAIGTPNEDVGDSRRDAGLVQVMFGGLLGFASSSMWHQDTSGIWGDAEAGDYFGASLAAGNFGIDSIDDLAIGVPGEDLGEYEFDAGAVLLLEVVSGDSRLYYQGSDLGQGGPRVEGKFEAQNFFGSALAAGDVNSDGRADLAIAVPGEDIGSREWAGAVNVLHGDNQTFGLNLNDDQVWHQDATNVLEDSERGDSFGGRKPKSVVRSSIPLLESNPGATRTLFLDFRGQTAVPQFTMDGRDNFNWTELSVIEHAWSYVAEDFAPFNINVTTSASFAGGEVLRVLIGGEWNGFTDGPASGWGPGDFTNDAFWDNNVFVFSGSILSGFSNVGNVAANISNGNMIGRNLAAMIGTTASHEAGHGFGLDHKGTLLNNVEIDEYSDGDPNDWTPIMGGNLNTDRTIWTQQSVNLIAANSVALGNNDFAVLRAEMGLRPDDHAADFNQATILGPVSSGDMIRGTGIIESVFDRDLFMFDVAEAGSYTISVSVNDVGPNLDSRLTLFDSLGNPLQTDAPNGGLVALDASITYTLEPGDYFAEVSSEARFTGDVGQYTVRVLGNPRQYPLTFVPPRDDERKRREEADVDETEKKDTEDDKEEAQRRAARTDSAFATLDPRKASSKSTHDKRPLPSKETTESFFDAIAAIDAKGLPGDLF